MTEWNIQSRAHVCGACGKPFADQEAYHTLLFDEKADFRRSDICQGCWQKQYSEGARDRKGFVSYWHGVYEAPAARIDPIQRENAESLLRKLIELNDPRYIPAAYILAVMLERKRLPCDDGGSEFLWRLKFEIWSFSGGWMLVLGAS